MTKRIVFADGGLTVDGVVVRPPHPVTAGGDPPSMLRMCDALRSYQRLVAPLEANLMVTTMRAHRRNATPAQRNYRTPEFTRSVEKIAKARALYGRIASECMPAGMDMHAFYADVMARHRSGPSPRPRNQRVDRAELAAMVRDALIRALRDETSAAFRAGDVARCRLMAGMWLAALNSH